MGLRLLSVAGIVLILFSPIIFSQQQDEQKALQELRSLTDVPKTKLFKMLQDGFLSKIREGQLKESLLIMFSSNPPQIVLTSDFLPEYIPDNYTIYAPSEDSPVVAYLIGQYICHILYGKDLYKQMAQQLLIKDNLNALIQLQDPLWFKPTGKPGSLDKLINKMTYQGTWLNDLARFFAMVINDERFEKPLWQLDPAGGPQNIEEIDPFWLTLVPEKTEGYILTVLNDIYDHEMFRGEEYLPDDDPLNILNGLDIIITAVLSKGVRDFSEFELAFAELFGNVDPLFRDVIYMNNWQLQKQHSAEEELVRDADIPKIVVHPQLEPVTEFDKLQQICLEYQVKIIRDNKDKFIQFIAPMDYVLSTNRCEGTYLVLEIVKMEGDKAEATVKEGPINVSMDLEAVKLSLNWDKKEKERKPSTTEQEPPFPPADEYNDKPKK